MAVVETGNVDFLHPSGRETGSYINADILTTSALNSTNKRKTYKIILHPYEYMKNI